MKRHLKRLKGKETTQRLLVLTPDESCPDVIAKVKDNRVVWASFASLDQAIEELLGDRKEIISEREAFILRQLQIMLIEEKLVPSTDNVVVVPAGRAWKEYNQFRAYVCQPNRFFRPVRYIAFYSSNKIHEYIPQILKIHESVEFKHGDRAFARELRNVVDQMLESNLREEGSNYKVFLLSAPDDPRTERLDAPIENTVKSDAGRRSAFTQYQRYVSLSALERAKTTSELLKGE